MKHLEVTLGDLLSLEYGKALVASDRDTSGQITVAGSNGPDGFHSDSLVAGPGIVVGRKGSAGKISWYEGDFWPIDTAYYVVPKAPLVLQWAYYLLQHLKLDVLATTTGVPGLNRKDAYDLKVPYPSVTEQRRTVEILDQADQLRRLLTQVDVKANRILPALFLKMFGDPVSNPLGWPILPLKALGQLDRGRSRHRPRNDPKLLGGPYPFIQTGDVACARGLIRSYTATYSELGLAQSRLWPAGTLCITIAANIAASGILDFDACFPDSIVGFTPGERANSAYVRVLLGLVRASLEHKAPQMAQKNINLEILRELPVPVPPKAHLDAFARRHDAVLGISEAIERSSELLERTWAILMHQAFSGQLTLSWRQGRMIELLEEMEHQAEALAVSARAERAR